MLCEKAKCICLCLHLGRKCQVLEWHQSTSFVRHLVQHYLDMMLRRKSGFLARATICTGFLQGLWFPPLRELCASDTLAPSE